MTDIHLDQLLDELRLGTIKQYYGSFSLEAIKTNKTMVDYLKALVQDLDYFDNFLEMSIF